MPGPLAVIGTALGLGSAVQNLLGMEFASDEATAARDWSAEQAGIQRTWQEKMRATQYQTAIEDMKKAGLNPMLAYHQGGAGVPSGAMGQSSAASTPGQNMAGLQTAAQVNLLEAQADKTRQETQNLKDDNPNIRGIQGMQNTQMALWREQAEQTNAFMRLNDEQRRLVYEEIQNAVEQRRRIQADTRDILANAVLRELEAPQARNRANVQDTWWMKNVGPYLHSGKQASEIFRNVLTPATRGR